MASGLTANKKLRHKITAAALLVWRYRDVTTIRNEINRCWQRRHGTF